MTCLPVINMNSDIMSRLIYMYKFRLPIIIVCIIILIILRIYLVKLSPMIEIFNTKNKDNKLVCIGDSILNNTNYVPVGKSVINYLRGNMVDVINVAQDNAKIEDVYDQIRRIPDIKSNMNIILSVGGNDLLEYGPIKPVYEKYIKLVRYITDKYIDTYKCKLYVLNLYYPKDESMKKYYKIIRNWNSLLVNIPIKYNINMNIIDISKIIKEPTDLVHEIEPSATGGLKIADKIIQSVNK